MPRVVQPKGRTAPAASAGAAKKPGAGAKRSKLYNMPERVAEGTILTDLSKGQWRIGPSIGTGGFGEIYTACRVGEKNYDFVVKCEPHANGPLFVEMHFYMRNARLEDIQKFKSEHRLKSLGMPYMIGNGSAEVNGQKHRFIVMPRYGKNISGLVEPNGGQMPEGTAYRLSLQMLDVYEFIHSSGYVHADLKGANILLGLGKGGGAQAYLVDYGLASHITTKEFKPDPKKMHNGTIEYTSRDAHQGVATMRADMEILGYNLIEWLGGILPWVAEKLLTVPTKVQKAKETFMADVSSNLKKIFPKGVPGPLNDFLKYVSRLQYNETPDYDKCRKIFTSALKTLKVPLTGDLEFKMPKAKAGAAAAKPPAAKKAKKRADDSDEEICASDDDDSDVLFEEKKPVKVAPQLKNKLKTVKEPPVAKSSPPKKAKLSPSPRRALHSSATKNPGSGSPQSKSKTAERAIGLRISPRTQSAATNGSSGATPITAKANLKFSPAVSLASSASRPGKTIINDQLTPKPKASKTYEFNFELDVSMDANVVVNVKRKKKQAAGIGTSASQPSTGSSGTPVTRVKVRKLESSEDSSSSPRTPAVTVKKTKRFASPR